MTCLQKLVSHEESAKPTSLANNFDIILEEGNAMQLNCLACTNKSDLLSWDY